VIEQDPQGNHKPEGSTFTQDPDRDASGKFSITALPGRRGFHFELSRVRLVIILAGLVAVGLIGYAIWLAFQPIPDHSDEFRATSIALLTATVAPYSPELTGTMTISGTLPARTAIPGETPSSTPTPTGTPTRQPGPALSRTPSSTSSRPASTPTSAPLPAPILLEPKDGETLLDRAVFNWLWQGPSLKANQAFDLRIWSAQEEQRGAIRRGAISPTQGTQAEVDLRYVPTVQDYGPGDYYWTVLVVEIGSDGSPVVVGEWGEERRFVYRR
jgi:hypothetical protein